MNCGPQHVNGRLVDVSNMDIMSVEIDTFINTEYYELFVNDVIDILTYYFEICPTQLKMTIGNLKHNVSLEINNFELPWKPEGYDKADIVEHVEYLLRDVF